MDVTAVIALLGKYQNYSGYMVRPIACCRKAHHACRYFRSSLLIVLTVSLRIGWSQGSSTP